MSEPVNLAVAFSLTPQAALDYFRSKGYRVNPDGWAAVEAAAHRKAFTVARVASIDVLKDIRDSVDKALNEGLTFADFQKRLMPTLKTKGWWGLDENGVQLGSPHRLSTIFRTNLQTSYMEGRWRGVLENTDERPWLQYIAILDSRTRPAHRALHGKVFRYDDPFWRTHRAPLGWNCRCRFRSLSDADLQEMSLTPESGAGRMVNREVPVQGTTQPQAGYRDPVTGHEITTDVGWGYDRLQGWEPDPKAYPMDLALLILAILEESQRAGNEP